MTRTIIADIEMLIVMEDDSRGPCKTCGYAWSWHITHKLRIGGLENSSCGWFEMDEKPTIH